MGRWSRLAAPLLVKFASLPTEGDVLDFGAGTGSLSFAVAQAAPGRRVHGVDPSAEFVAFARDKNRAADLVRFEVGDAQDLGFPDKCFGAALSLFAINFIPHPAKALSEAVRVTRSGGSVAAATWDYPEGMSMLRLFWDAAASLDEGAEPRDENRMPLCREGELTQLWLGAGLGEVRETKLEIVMRFTSFDDYWQPFLLGQGPAGAYTLGLDEARRAALREELKRRLRASDESDPIELRARAWAVRGVSP